MCVVENLLVVAAGGVLQGAAGPGEAVAEELPHAAARGACTRHVDCIHSHPPSTKAASTALTNTFTCSLHHAVLQSGPALQRPRSCGTTRNVFLDFGFRIFSTRYQEVPLCAQTSRKTRETNKIMTRPTEERRTVGAGGLGVADAGLGFGRRRGAGWCW